MKYKLKRILAIFIAINIISVQNLLAQNGFVIPENIPNFDNNAQCNAGALKPASAFASKLKDKALIEWGYFGKQTIDETGKLLKVGGHEGETDIDVSGGAQFSYEVPWFNVLRYWKILQSIGGYENFRNSAYFNQDFLVPNSTTGTGKRGQNGFDTKIGPIINKINNNDLFDGVDKKILENALLRSAIIDMPWSGAFISAMHAMAFETIEQKPAQELKFQFSGRHSVYIKDAYQTALQEMEKKDLQNYSLYRACNGAKTVPRIGDMYCYVRLNAGAKFKEYNISQSYDIAAYLYFNGGEQNLRNTHCDIVVNIDKANHFMDLIGGNVYQSVSLKRLWLSEDNILAESIFENNIDAKDKAKLCRKNNCNLNAKPWFVLLQNRD